MLCRKAQSVPEFKMEPEPILLFMRMNPRWVIIDEIGRMVAVFCSCAYLGKEREDQLTLAVHELVQNAVTNEATGEIELSLTVDARRDRVSVSVSNICTPGMADRLNDRLAAMYEEPDAMLYYVRVMAESLADVRAGLGLARIRCEAQLDVQAKFDGFRVTVTASGKLGAATEPIRGVVEAFNAHPAKPVIRPRAGSSVQVSAETYSAVLAAEADGNVVHLKGTISTPNPAILLNPFVHAAHKELSSAGVRHVDVDLCDLEFCNSSGLKSFIYWIQLIQKLSQPHQYKLRFRVNPRRRWQKTTLLALSRCAVELTEIVNA